MAKAKKPKRRRPAPPARITSAVWAKGWSAADGGRIRPAEVQDASRVLELLSDTGGDMSGDVDQILADGRLGALLPPLFDGENDVLHAVGTRAFAGELSEAIAGLACVLVACDRSGAVVGCSFAMAPGRVLSQVAQVDQNRSLVMYATIIKLKGLAVDAAHRRVGWGRALARRTMQVYAQLGYHFMYGQCSAEAHLETFYRSLGFDLGAIDEPMSLAALTGVPVSRAAPPARPQQPCWPLAVFSLAGVEARGVRALRLQRAGFCTVQIRPGVQGYVMISPYVRRRRLAFELRGLREAAGETTAGLASRIGQSRMKISRLENGHIRPDQADIMQILEVLGVEGDVWAQVMRIAREAAERGWWESYGASMGQRQALYADLEAGAVAIREFQQPFIPGLVQTPEFAAARIEAESQIGPAAFDAERVLEARAGRQRMLHRPDGPTYEVVLDEIGVRRMAAPPEVVAAQLRHLVDLTAAEGSNVVVRVLPVAACIEGYTVPRSPFSLYTYPDGDPTVVAVDTVTSDVVITELGEPEEVHRYTTLFARLCDAALDAGDSRAFLTDVADDLDKQGSA